MKNNIPANVMQYRERVLEKTKAFHAGKTLLDSGCGDGCDASLRLPYFSSVTATDIEENPAWKELSGKKLKFKKADSEKLPFKSSSFDTVIEKDMLHHARDPYRAMKEMVRVAKKRVIVIEANRYNPLFYINLTLINNHQHFTRKKFRDIVASAGMPYELRSFSARVCPINIVPVIKAFNGVQDFMENIGPYKPIIEYNLGIITKR
ncbi:MAG: class I SAM-dependent methyltransferase [Spirochaetia bacterium]|nr:class I SAM-dependent methyltransferase [Spirochaetia bacterium]